MGLRRPLFLSALLLLSLLAAVLFFAWRPGRGTTGTVSENAPSSRPAPAGPLAEFPAWGGAVCSADHEEGRFFDAERARVFLEAAGPAARYVVRLRSRSMLPDPAAVAEEALAGASPQAVYVQFHDEPSAGQRAELAAAGVALIGYVDAYAWQAWGTAEAFRAARRLPFVRALAALDPRDKLEPALYRGAEPAHARAPDGRWQVQVLGFPGTALADLAETALAAGADLRPGRPCVLGPRFELTGGREAVLALAALPRTHYFEFVPPPVAARDTVLDAESNVDDVRDNPPNLDGTGVTVAVREVQKIVPHADFSARYTDVDAASGETSDAVHATAVAGQVGGDGTLQPAAKGIAPKVTLLGYDLKDSAFSTADIVDAATRGARISNHSYGPTGVGKGDYTTDSANWDAAARTGDLIVVFAGNEIASGNPTAGDYKQVDFLVGSKNVIDVSSTNDTAHAGDDSPFTPSANGIANFVDFGPMADGRIKPDLVANGDSVRLLQGANGVQTNTGTSFSAPAISGLAALLHQHYKNRIGPGFPSAALTKALLLDTATDLGNTGPDAQYGFGIANVEKAVKLIDLFALSPAGNKPWIEDTIANGEMKTYALNIGPQPDLKVMLVWMDPPKSPAATPALVNDLDLEVQPPGLIPAVLPFSLNPASPAAPATNSARNSVDNVEQVIIAAPTPGAYTLRVKGTNVPTGPQPFVVLAVKDSAVGLAISATPAPPGVAIGSIAYLPVTGGDVSFTALINGGTPPYLLEWDFNGDLTPDRTDSAPGSPFTTSPPFTYPAGAATYTALLKLTDATTPAPNVSVASATVQVLAPPSALLVANPTAGQAPLDVSFSAAAPNGVILSYLWDFGDGSSPVTTSTGGITHIYATLGSFTATLTLTDVVGQTSAPSSVTITTKLREVEGFSYRLRAGMNFGSGKGRLQMVLIVSELALSRQEVREMVRDDVLTNKVYHVFAETPLGDFVLGEFVVDARGQQVQGDRRFKLLLSRKGQIFIEYHKPGTPQIPSVIQLFDLLGMTSVTPSGNPKVSADDFSLPVRVEASDVLYRGAFRVIWTNRGKSASARNRTP